MPEPVTHPGEEVASPARRALNRLLASFPAAEVVYVGRPPYLMHVPMNDERMATRDETPWLCCDLYLALSPDTVRRFAIWKATGDVYELEVGRRRR